MQYYPAPRMVATNKYWKPYLLCDTKYILYLTLKILSEANNVMIFIWRVFFILSLENNLKSKIGLIGINEVTIWNKIRWRWNDEVILMNI